MASLINRRVVIEELGAKLRRLAWRRHLLSAACIVTFCTAGAVLPRLVLKPDPQTYISQAVVKITPLNGMTVETRRLAATMQQDLLSPVALTLAASELKLKPGDVTGVEAPGRIGIFLDMVMGTQEPDLPASAVEAALQNAVTMTSSSREDIDITARAATSEASQKIADYLSRQVARNVGADQSGPGLRAVETARAALDATEAALTGFQMRHGNDAISHIQSLQQKLHEMEIAAAALEQKQTALTQAVTAASAMKAEDVLTKNLPSLPAFAALEPIRENYQAATLALAEINVDHGPKHPRSIAAQAAVDAAKAAAMPALRQALVSVKDELKTATALLFAQTGEKSAIASQLQALGPAPEELSQLEQALGKARHDYLAASEKAGPFAAPRISAVVAKAALPGVAQKDSLTSVMLAAGGGMAGLLIALFALSFRRTETDEAEDVEVIAPEIAEPEIDDVEPHDEVEYARAEPVEMEPDIFHDLLEPQAADTPDEDASDVEADAATDIDDAAEAGDPAQTQDDLQDEAANDIPLDERVRQVLMSNSMSYEDEARERDGFSLPPLLAAALQGKAHHAEAQTQELEALRQELALLKAELNGYHDEEAERRSA